MLISKNNNAFKSRLIEVTVCNNLHIFLSKFYKKTIISRRSHGSARVRGPQFGKRCPRTSISMVHTINSIAVSSHLLYHSVLRYATRCYTWDWLYFTTICHKMLYYTLPCYATLNYSLLNCYAMLNYDVLHVGLCNTAVVLNLWSADHQWSTVICLVFRKQDLICIYLIWR